MSLLKASSSISQSYFIFSDIGLEFSPFDEQALLMFETSSISIAICTQTCFMALRCRIFNFDSQTKRCRLYEGDVDSTGVIVTSLSAQSTYGSIQLTVNDFADYGRPCSYCEGSRYLTCTNSICQCQPHTYFNGSICRSQRLNGSECDDYIECRNDLNLTCQSNMQCGYNFTSNYTTSSTTSTSSTTTVTSTTTSVTTTTTTTTRMLCNFSCLNQTWISSANLLAEWLFDGNYLDQMNTYNAMPVNNMSFITNGYIKQAIQFANNGNQTLNVPYIPLSSTSFSIDMWLYITALQNINDHGLFSYCSHITTYNCLHITVRQTNGNYHLYFGFFYADCAGISSLALNTWIHTAFVFDSTTLTQKIYLNGILENNCTQSSALTVTPTNITIGYLAWVYASHGGVAYFQGYMDQMTVSKRAKSACEVLEIATLVAYFTFDTGLFLTDSGPNSLQATTQSTSSVSTGRYSQAIHFDGSNSSYYQISDCTALGISNRPFSISFWLRPTSLSGIVVHVSTLASGNGWCLPFLGFARNGSFAAQIWNGASAVAIGAPASSVSISVWSHIVQTWSSTNGLRLYINNVLVASQLFPTYAASSLPNFVTLGNGLNARALCVMGQLNTITTYKGDIDDFRVYSRELSAADICTLFTN